MYISFLSARLLRVILYEYVWVCAYVDMYLGVPSALQIYKNVRAAI